MVGRAIHATLWMLYKDGKIGIDSRVSNNHSQQVANVFIKTI